MAAMLKDGRHLEFLIGTRTFFKRVRSICRNQMLYHNLKDSSTLGQLSAGLLLILFRIMA